MVVDDAVVDVVRLQEMFDRSRVPLGVLFDVVCLHRRELDGGTAGEGRELRELEG